MDDSHGIIVTAQRREQRSQDVPLAISVLSGAHLKTAGVVTTQDLPAVSSGLTTTSTRNGMTPYLRGVGTQSVTSEQSVAIYVDNVYIAAPVASMLSLNNVERIEVLKGPQGTLFGRNATGGLIHVITRTPSDTPELKLGIGYSSYDTFRLNMYATGGLAQNVAADIAVYVNHQGDGWGKNLLFGNDVNLSREYSVRSKIKAQPGDRTTITLTGDFSRTQSDFGTVRQTADGTVASGGITRLGSIYDYNSSFSGGPVYKATQYGVSLRMDHELSDTVSLQSTSAYRRNHIPNYTDSDATPAYLSEAYILERNHSLQQELLLKGNGGRLSWTTGLFYFDYDRGMQPAYLYSTIANRASYRYSAVRTHSYSGFGQASYALAKRTNLTLGLRYTEESNVARGQIRSMTAAGPDGVVGAIIFDTETRTDGRSNHERASKWTWRASLDRKIGDAVLLYASINRGFKSGTYNTFSIDDLPTKPETLDAYEIGLKSDLVPHLLRLNASAYAYDYRNIQVTTVLAAGSGDRNAASGRIKGVDLELVLSPPLPQGQLQLRGAVTWLDAKYRRFPGAVVNVPNIRIDGTDYKNAATLCPLAASGQPMIGTLLGGNTTCSLDASGRRLIRSPSFSSNLGIDLSQPVTRGLDGALNVNWQHMGAYYWDPYNLIRSKPYDLVNAQLSLQSQDTHWKLSLWGRNLTNTKYYVQLSPSASAAAAAPGAPRTLGVMLERSFGGR